MKLQNPVIVVPGITATNLDDFYELPPEEVWSTVIKKKYTRISLHPDNQIYEAKQPARIRSGSIFDLVYEDLVESLREELKFNEEVIPVFPFGYDWRQDCTLTADLLDVFVEEVISRTKLLPHYKSKDFQVDLVGHSMGGLIIADYLKRYGDKKLIRRVVSLGSPFQGSIDAILKIVIGKGHLTGENPRDRERVSARSIPSLYQLLPSYGNAIVSINEAPTEIFDIKTWQDSIIISLNNYIKKYKADITAEKLLEKYLNGAKEFQDRFNSLNLDECLEEKQNGWLAIVGIGSETQVRIENVKKLNKCRFRVVEDKNEWTKQSPDNEFTGDGTVPYQGAIPKFIDKNKIVCVCPEDFSRWEIRDRVLAKLSGFHGFLPAVNLVERLVIKFLRNDYQGHVWGWRPPTVSKDDWSPPDWLEPRYIEDNGK